MVEENKKSKLETYSVRLDSELVEKALKIVKKYGGKLSPFINEQLKIWIKQMEEQEQTK